jgi:hypothetical protein
MAQDYKNHRQYVFGFHIITYLLIIVCFIGSIINLSNSFTNHSNLYSASLIVVMNIVIGLLAVYARRFALKAQDRAIRAEQNLRHLAITGKLHDPALSTGQIIALRFAGDEEYLELAKKAVAERLTNDQIKRAIRHWKADLNRV